MTATNTAEAQQTAPTDATVHLRVPAALKAQWVRDSRAAGMRLTDWIVQRVEARAETSGKDPSRLPKQE